MKGSNANQRIQKQNYFIAKLFLDTHKMSETDSVLSEGREVDQWKSLGWHPVDGDRS